MHFSSLQIRKQQHLHSVCTPELCSRKHSKPLDRKRKEKSTELFSFAHQLLFHLVWRAVRQVSKTPLLPLFKAGLKAVQLANSAFVFYCVHFHFSFPSFFSRVRECVCVCVLVCFFLLLFLLLFFFFCKPVYLFPCGLRFTLALIVSSPVRFFAQKYI